MIRTAGRALRGPIVAAALVLQCIAAPAGAVESNTGSAQPYLGWVAAGPFVFKSQANRLVVEVAVRFKPEAAAIVSSPAFGAAEKKRLNLEIYATVLEAFLDEGIALDRTALKVRIGSILDDLLKTSAVDEVSFSRFEAQ